MSSAGIAFVSDGRVLLLRRSESVEKPGLWAFPGGGIEENETPLAAALREVKEEVGIELPSATLVFEDGHNFSLFSANVDSIQPVLNDEHDGYVWATLDDLPQPLHPGTEELVRKVMNSDFVGDSALAFDKSVRTYDQDGRLRVEMANISKSNICGYLGAEIPDYKTLGLDPKRLYMLFRAPEELEKAAATFNGIPLLNTHVPSTAWDHPKGKVVGTTGTDSVFEAPYLRNSLVVWTGDAIEGIESNKQRELSPGYRYRADMTPGVFNGESYDGVMRDIHGNHLALVEEGRTGSDVIVGDSKLNRAQVLLHRGNDGLYAADSVSENPFQFPLFAKSCLHLCEDGNYSTTTENTPMKTTALSKKAVLAKGALMASVRLAADAKLDLNTILSGVTHKNWAASKVKIADAIKPLLAADADIADVVRLLDHMDDEEALEEVVGDEEVEETEEEKAARLKKEKADIGTDEPEKTPGTPAAPAKDEKEEFVSKSAMDAAVKLASDSATAAAVQRLNAIRDAEDAVKPFVGKLAMSFDSAEGVYKAALETLGVDVKGVNPDAYRFILAAQKKPGEIVQTRMAKDSAPAAGFSERFPTVAAVRKV